MKMCIVYYILCTINFYSTIVVVKMAPIGTLTRNCFSRVRRSAGLSIPGRDTFYMSCSVFVCALRSLYSALNVIPLHYTRMYSYSVLLYFMYS